jgi:hypothetical protein
MREMTEKMRRAGRPPVASKLGQKATIGVRITPNLKDELNREAAANDRSLSQEAELRLEFSFRTSGLLAQTLALAYGPRVAGLLMLMGEALNMIGRSKARETSRPDAEWSDWPVSATGFDEAARGVVEVLERLRPSGDIVETDQSSDDSHAWLAIFRVLDPPMTTNPQKYAEIAEMLGPLVPQGIEPTRDRQRGARKP